MKNITQKIRTGIATAAIGLAAFVGSVRAEDASITPTSKEPKQEVIKNVYADSGYFFRYLGGFGFTNGKSPVNQSDIGFDVGPVSYNLWENFDLHKGKVTEIDHTFSHTFSTKHWNVTPEFIYFEFPQDNSGNAYSFDITARTKGYPLDLKVEANQTFGKGAHYGRLYQIGLGKTAKLTDRVNLSVEGRATYNDHFYTTEGNVSHVAATAKLNINLGKGFTLTPSITAQKAINSMGGTFVDHKAVYGLNLNKSF